MKATIFNWESSTMPAEWKNYLNDTDFILPSSNAVRNIFIENGWNKDKLITVPLGVDWENFESSDKMNITNEDSFKFLNISIPHFRKNIDLVLRAYYNEFSSEDNVSLIIKSSFDSPKNDFECDLKKTILDVRKEFKKELPKMYVVIDKFKNMAPLYNGIDAVISASSFEGFGLPQLEGFAAGKQVIAPRHSGHLDFLDDMNSFLIDSDIISAGKKYQYWKPIDSAKTYYPKIDQMQDAMRRVFNGERKTFNPIIKETFSWKNSANKIIDIYDHIHK
jgi:glycosyltransferase involved in cell wall biosynthesis